MRVMIQTKRNRLGHHLHLKTKRHLSIDRYQQRIARIEVKTKDVNLGPEIGQAF